MTTLHTMCAAAAVLCFASCDTALPPVVEDCSSAPVIDGRFTTSWLRTCVEYDGEPTSGIYGDLYLHYDGDTSVLSALNDWHLRDDAAAEPNMFNLFLLSTNLGQWDIRVFGDQHIEVLRNGVPYGGIADGRSGFGSSPRHPDPHSMFEFSLHLPGALTGFLLKEKDPAPGSAFTLVEEPTVFSGEVDDRRRYHASTADGPILWASEPPTAVAGEEVVFLGADLGQSGVLFFRDRPVEVLDWRDASIRAVVPSMSGDVLVSAQTEEGTSNDLVFTIGCARDCNERECGSDGCGGSCGTCLRGSLCEGGACEVCRPSCEAKQCGSNGCGGSCGACAPGSVCQGGVCRGCTPSCADSECGSDGCGGSCGVCSEGTRCSSGRCGCAPVCRPGACGSDGCGGSCPPCALGSCENERCTCIPSCERAACGSDGCGGSCGSCAAGQTCAADRHCLGAGPS